MATEADLGDPKFSPRSHEAIHSEHVSMILRLTSTALWSRSRRICLARGRASLPGRLIK
jgi:hypothetical protein